MEICVKKVFISFGKASKCIQLLDTSNLESVGITKIHSLFGWHITSAFQDDKPWVDGNIKQMCV